MIKRASNLVPGDIISIRGQRVKVEALTSNWDTVVIHHSNGVHHGNARTQYLVEGDFTNEVFNELDEVLRGRNV